MIKKVFVIHKRLNSGALVVSTLITNEHRINCCCDFLSYHNASNLLFLLPPGTDSEHFRTLVSVIYEMVLSIYKWDLPSPLHIRIIFKLLSMLPHERHYGGEVAKAPIITQVDAFIVVVKGNRKSLSRPQTNRPSQARKSPLFLSNLVKLYSQVTPPYSIKL